MRNVFDFSGLSSCEETIRVSWLSFRQDLASGLFLYNETDKAKERGFLSVYNDIFNSHDGAKYQIVTIEELKRKCAGRGTRLKSQEEPDYQRFIPNSKYINDDNRFSPPGIEWLYLSIGSEKDIRMCTKSECRIKAGERFGFCNFNFNPIYADCRLIDLTIADNYTYAELNCRLEEYGHIAINTAIINHNFKINNFYNQILRWVVYTYSKLLSEQIFAPLNISENKRIEYAPFQTMAHYYLSLGYSGIIYKSTVCPVGKNIVLFDKQIAYPIGRIEISVVS